MKRVALAVVCLLVIPSAVLAEAPRLQCSAQDFKLQQLAPSAQPPRSSGEHLFFDAEPYVGRADVELRYFLDGQLHLTEVLPLKSLQPAAKPTDGVPPKTVVELLAMRAPERKLLGTIGRAEPDRVKVEVWQDGTLQRSASFAQLQQESAALVGAPFRPEVVHSQVAGKGKRDFPKITALGSAGTTFMAAATCEENCAIDRDNCYANNCPGMDYCEECEAQYNQCLNNCQPPPPPSCPTVQYYWTPLYFVGWYTEPWNQVCYPDQIWYWYDGLWHVSVVFVYRRDLIKRTTHCDNSVTEEVVGYEYWYFQCYDWTSSPCYDPWYPFNTCY